MLFLLLVCAHSVGNFLPSLPEIECGSVRAVLPDSDAAYVRTYFIIFTVKVHQLNVSLIFR